MTEKEWLYIKDMYHVKMSYEEWDQVRLFETREKRWRAAHVNSGLSLSRKDWEAEEEAKRKAFLSMKKDKKRKTRNKIWRAFGVVVFVAYCALLVYINEA